jgi:hypothetical protein
MIAEGKVSHADIPDTPDVESERRQMFFGNAIGLPSFYVRKDTGNRLLQSILKKSKNVKPSGRYQNYLKVRNSDYKLALTQLLLDESAEMVDMLGLRRTMDDLTARLRDDGMTASDKLTRGILDSIGAREPMSVKAAEFNSAAERYYRTGLCAKHMREAFTFMEEDYSSARTLKEGEKTILKWILGANDAADFLKQIRDDVINDSVTEDELCKLISLVILSIHHDIAEAGKVLAEGW